MDTHIKLLLGALVLGVIAGAGALAWSLGALYLAPVIVIAFFFAVGWGASEPEILGRRLRLLLIGFSCVVLVGLFLKML
jgi:hypothetical protein